MAITTNASPIESSSPFYQKNQKICLEWDTLIKQFGGKVVGEFNSWSYKVKGQVETGTTWHFTITKATLDGYRSQLFLEDSIFEELEITSIIGSTKEKEFLIRRRNIFDNFRANAVQLNQNKNYVLIGVNEITPFSELILNIISHPLKSDKIYSVSYSKTELKIKIQLYDRSQEFVSNLLKTLTKGN
jgi:hypothetical protein